MTTFSRLPVSYSKSLYHVPRASRGLTSTTTRRITPLRAEQRTYQFHGPRFRTTMSSSAHLGIFKVPAIENEPMVSFTPPIYPNTHQLRSSVLAFVCTRIRR